MAKFTITEALAELKTIGKRLPAKQMHILANLARQEGLKDPLATEGGSAVVIVQTRQSIADLQQRHVNLRLAIQEINRSTEITIDGETHSIAWWLTWRKEILPGRKQFLNQLRQQLSAMRQQAQQKGMQVVTVNQTPQALTDIVVNIDEALLAKEIEHLEAIEGELDGQLSLKNATTMIEM
jgi:hypothetical protein